MLSLVLLSYGGASEDAVATTPAPNPHNQTTSAQTEVTGRVFLFSFCVVFCKFVFCIKFASEDAVATTPAPNPHNQTTSAQTEVTGRVFLFSFCVVFCKFVFCIKCVSVSLGFSLAPSLMWNPKMEPVKMLWTAKVMWLSPQHPIPTTRPHLPLLKLVVRFPRSEEHTSELQSHL